MMQHCKWTGQLAAAVIVLMGATVQAVQLQDITRLKGAETNTLIGQGLVVGLKGTGDVDGAQSKVKVTDTEP